MGYDAIETSAVFCVEAGCALQFIFCVRAVAVPKLLYVVMICIINFIYKCESNNGRSRITLTPKPKVIITGSKIEKHARMRNLHLYLVQKRVDEPWPRIV